MSLTPGTRLGPYEIGARIGAGGMGEVYRATDTNLARQVAIKVLPAALAADVERIARFDREAKTLAALNHPNIATIFGLERSEGRTALVMELIEGPTLADRTGHGAIPLEEAVAIARQIAEALEAAHERGIVHRDLKPANVKVTPAGPVKVLDFGLATAVRQSVEEAGAGRSDSPTLTIGATGAGVILGTAGYMSPEQAAGKPVDKRSDIWSFGVVLWEMLTGAPLFAGGETTSHVLADVLRAPIDFTRIPGGPLRDLLQRCLDRDVTTRLRDIGEARIALARPLRPVPTETAPVGAGAGVIGSARIAWAAAVMLAITAGIALWAPWTVEPEKPFVRLDVDLGPDVALVRNAQSTVRLSPDGSRLVYVTVPSELFAMGAPGRAARASGGRGGQRGRSGGASGALARLFVRRLDQPGAIELPDAANASNLFFSPDGQWIGFGIFAGGGRGGSFMLYKISVEGGAAVPVAEIADFGGGDWADDGTIVVGGSNGLWRIPPGGQPVQLTKPRDRERAHLGPRILPGGRTALFASISGEPDSTTAVIEAASLADGTRKELVRGGISPHYLPTGHLVYMSNGALFAIAFDPEALGTRGTAVPILDDVQFAAVTGEANLSFSRDGTLVYRKGERIGGIGSGRLATIDWVDASGKRSPLLSQPQRFSRLRFSPDGKQLAVLIVDDAGRDYWVYDLQRGTRNKITFGGLSVSTVAWSPDSRHLFVGSGAGGRANSIGIYWTSADGASQPQRILERQGGVLFPTSFSGAANRLLYGPIEGDILLLPLAREQGQWKAGAPETFIDTEFSEVAPAFSRDGRWIAYATNETGRFEVKVRAFPPPASGQPRQWTVSTNGGTRPLWSADGRELLYQEGDRIMAVRYAVSGDEFKLETPRVRVERLGANDENWDLAPDGRIAVVTPVEGDNAAPSPVDRTVVFLQNFFDEVKRRVP
jgi:serine/threonine-protein kinase